jgi:hypothetical protein
MIELLRARGSSLFVISATRKTNLLLVWVNWEEVTLAVLLWGCASEVKVT